MKNSVRAISTARGVALLRAVESSRPANERVFADPYARSFVNPLSYLASRPVILSGLPDRLLLGGTIAFAIAREQHVHDEMSREIGAGLEQVVILGAGFDTRAYRTPGMDALTVFEVDHPITQGAKRKAIRGVVEPMPANVRFVAVDFDTDSLGERLKASGYREDVRTLFVWQGVTMYLTPGGVDATLGFIARHSGPGSVVIFDYFYSDVLHTSEAASLRAMTWLMGEKVTFGIAADGIVPFLTSRGFSGIETVDGAALQRRYLTKAHARGPIKVGAAIVTARVAGPSVP